MMPTTKQHHRQQQLEQQDTGTNITALKNISEPISMKIELWGWCKGKEDIIQNIQQEQLN
jgi:hypothetical protein